MGYDGDTDRQVFDVRLSDELVRQARSYTQDLSVTLEQLLAAFVDRERARENQQGVALEQTMAALNKFHQTYGLLSDEFPMV